MVQYSFIYMFTRVKKYFFGGLTPPSSTVGWLTVGRIKKHEKKKQKKMVITAQYKRYALRPEVSTTSGRGCFELSQTDTQTDKHGNSAQILD